MKSLWLRKALKSRLQIATVVHWEITRCETVNFLGGANLANDWRWSPSYPYCKLLWYPGTSVTSGVAHDISQGATLKVLDFLNGKAEYVPTCETCRVAAIAWGIDEMTKAATKIGLTP